MRIIAIDLGSSQIKLALFERRFTKFDILQYEVLEVPDYLDPLSPYASQNLVSEAQLEVLKKIHKDYPNFSNRIIMNTPIGLYTSRVLEFPFKNIKKITKNARFQIEDEIPFDPDKCIITNKIIANQTDTGATLSLCSIALEESIKNFTSLLYEETNLEPSILTTVQASFVSTLEHLFKNATYENVAIMDFGHRNSSIYFYKETHPLIQKTIPIGGYHITKAIAEAYDMSFAEAEIMKIQKSCLTLPGSKLKNEEARLSETIAATLEPIFFDFNQCIMAFFSEHQVLLDRIYICGGTSLIKNMKPFISNQWNIETRLLNLNAHLPGVSTSPPPNTEPMLAQVTALGMTQVQKDAKNTPNFHTEQLRPRDHMSIDIKAYSKFMRTAIIIYFIAIVSLGIQSFVLSSHLKRQSSSRDANIQKVLGKLSSGILYKLKRNPEEIKNRTDKKLKSLRETAGVTTKKNTFFTLNILKSFSENILIETVTEINKIKINRNSIKLNFKSPNKKTAQATLDTIKFLSFVEKIDKPKQKRIGNELSSNVLIKIKQDTRKL